ncbi:hypothetical protein RFI_18306 [Reticulomyxa filosa]|uniref:CCHC-type domain-containing protein n=1 Tax=Reticulomyxa filosa TaxID=46433 RepID=X6N0U5_RETFI|nr:hypothetical protein RFI_18306 [Reticulomyxa filosa]|eukprot:ETO18937.1 hypothetical protein RFI_18306 [Reticulomyxa filosa]
MNLCRCCNTYKKCKYKYRACVVLKTFSFFFVQPPRGPKVEKIIKKLSKSPTLMFQQNQILFGQGPSVPAIVPFTFTTGELDLLRSKLQLAEQQLLSNPSKNTQSIIQVSLSEMRTLEKMVEMTLLQGLKSSWENVASSGSSPLSNPKLRSNTNTSPPGDYICHKCGIEGHYVHDCSNVYYKGTPPTNYVCYKCNTQGHWIQKCPLSNSHDYTKSPPTGYCCHRCGFPGHWIKNCPTNDKHLGQSTGTLTPSFRRDKSFQPSIQQPVLHMFTNNDSKHTNGGMLL